MWTAGIRNLGGFLKEVFVGDQVPALSQGLSCSTTEKQRGKEGNIIHYEIRAVATCQVTVIRKDISRMCFSIEA